MSPPPASDEDVAFQILAVFAVHRIPAQGILRRINFTGVRDGDFRRGMDRAIANQWVQPHERDRYRYILTEVGKAALTSHPH
mgnify:CR=1 FL=1